MSGGLDDYKLLGELGRGGMGIVYQAQDKKLGRTVAIKMIRVDAGASPGETAKLRQRLVREASAAGRIYHPGIVTVHQLGEYGDNVFVVMEYVEGSSLEHLLTNNPVLDRTWTMNILHQIADALDYAHKSGVVHRDVKPANILVRADGRVKVADFGIAKIASEASAMTATGVSLGSPSYMSPEQIQATQIDGRSDQFALAIIAFQMLTGKMPFRGDTAHSVMYQIVTADPFQQAADDLSLSPAVRQVLSRALAKSPTDRFPDCGSFIGALMAAQGLAAQPMQSSTAKLETLPPAVAAKKKSAAPLLIGVLLTVLLLGGVYWLLIYPRCCAPKPLPDPRVMEQPLIKAIESGVPADIDKNISASTVNAANPDGTTPLLAAIRFGKLDVVKTLLAKGANVNQPARDGATPLMAAAEGTPYMPFNLPLVEAVLAANPDIQAQDAGGRTALHYAVEQGKLEVAALLVDKGAQIDRKTNDGTTPLLASVLYGKLPLLQLLLERKAQVDLANVRGETPLMIAAEGTAYMPNNAPLVEALMGAGAHVDSVDQRGCSALYRASAAGKEDAMALLIEHQANPNLRASDRSTPLMEAVTFAKLGAAKLLIDHGADVNLSDANDSTALMLAADASPYIRDPAVYIKLLLDHGAKKSAVDSHGRTALQRATESKNAAAIEALK
jgi:ankyrin repeat protein/predicted Ser/Thr protein kinase